MKLNATITNVMPNQVMLVVETQKLQVGMKVTLSVGQKRSTAQNRLYFKMLELVSEDTGYTKDELHQLFKSEFLGDKIEVLDKPFLFTRSTTKLTVAQFTKYLSDIRYWVYDKLGWNLPLE